MGSVSLGATDLNSDPVGGELLDDGGDERDVAGKPRRRRPLQNDPEVKMLCHDFEHFWGYLVLKYFNTPISVSVNASASASASDVPELVLLLLLVLVIMKVPYWVHK